MTRLAWLSLLLCAAGCNAAGPRALRGGRQDYNEVVHQTTQEQLLLNLVRLRYLESPLFLDVASITASYQFENSLGVGVSVPNANAHGSVFNPSARTAWLEKPTIAFLPLQGDRFVTQLLSPLTLDKLLLLAHSGWSVERILRVCVQRLNGLENASSASGPAPERGPEFAEFLSLARQLRALQVRGLLDLGAGAGDDEGALVLRVDPRAEGSEELAALRRAFGAAADARRFALLPGVGKREDGKLTVETRSLLGAMFYLSHGVRVPAEDEAAGRVRVTQGPDGGRFDWDGLLGDLLRVECDAEPEASASVAVSYRGHDFYLADDDISSKATFAFLAQLFALQAGNAQGAAPLLTLSVGN